MGRLATEEITRLPAGARAAASVAVSRAAEWDLRSAVRLGFPEPAALADNAAHTALLRTYLNDLLKQEGLALDEAKFAASGHSYGEMAEELIRLAVPADEPVDLLLLASAVPDLAPGRSTAIYLSHVCPGSPLAFAIQDQGAAAAFTALRIAVEYARTDGLSSCLLLVVEQASVPYDTGGSAVPTEHAGVALLLGRAEASASQPAYRAGELATPARLAEVRITANVRTRECALAELRSAISALGPHHDETALILCSHLAPNADDLRFAFCDDEAPDDGKVSVHLAHPGRPSTGVWWELVSVLEKPRRHAGRALAAEYDPDSATLCLAAFDTAAFR